MHKTLLKKIDYNMHKDCIEDSLDMLLCEVKELNPKLYDHVEDKLYVAVYGKKISDEMAEKWVKDMQPMAKWTKEDVSNVVSSYGITNIPLNCAYVLMNMLYSDSSKIYGTGDDTESLEKYIQGVKDWYFDTDLKINGEEKLYNYYKYIYKAE